MQDFNPTVLAVTFPADEAPSETIFYVDVPITIVDDDINEAEQNFIVYFEVIDAINENLILSERNVAVCTITDEDGEYINTIDYVHGIGNEVTCAHSDNTIFFPHSLTR